MFQFNFKKLRRFSILSFYQLNVTVVKSGILKKTTPKVSSLLKTEYVWNYVRELQLFMELPSRTSPSELNCWSENRLICKRWIRHATVCVSSKKGKKLVVQEMAGWKQWINQNNRLKSNKLTAIGERWQKAITQKGVYKFHIYCIWKFSYYKFLYEVW